MRTTNVYYSQIKTLNYENFKFHPSRLHHVSPLRQLIDDSLTYYDLAHLIINNLCCQNKCIIEISSKLNNSFWEVHTAQTNFWVLENRSQGNFCFHFFIVFSVRLRAIVFLFMANTFPTTNDSKNMDVYR